MELKDSKWGNGLNKSSVLKLEGEISFLENRLKQTENERVVYEKQRDKEFSTAMKDMEGKVKDAEAKLREKGIRLSHVMKQLTQTKQLLQELEARENQLKKSKLENTDCSSIVQPNKSLTRTSFEERQSDDKIIHYQVKIESLEFVLMETKAELQSAKANERSALEELEQYRTRVNLLERDLTARTKELMDARTMLVNTQTATRSSIEEREDLLKRIASLHGQLTTAKSELRIKESELQFSRQKESSNQSETAIRASELEEQLRQKATQLANTREDLVETKARLSEASAMLERIVQENLELSNQLMSSHIGELEEKIRLLTHQCSMESKWRLEAEETAFNLNQKLQAASTSPQDFSGNSDHSGQQSVPPPPQPIQTPAPVALNKERKMVFSDFSVKMEALRAVAMADEDGDPQEKVDTMNLSRVGAEAKGTRELQREVKALRKMLFQSSSLETQALIREYLEGHPPQQQQQQQPERAVVDDKPRRHVGVQVRMPYLSSLSGDHMDDTAHSAVSHSRKDASTDATDAGSEGEGGSEETKIECTEALYDRLLAAAVARHEEESRRLRGRLERERVRRQEAEVRAELLLGALEEAREKLNRQHPRPLGEPADSQLVPKEAVGDMEAAALAARVLELEKEAAEREATVGGMETRRAVLELRLRDTEAQLGGLREDWLRTQEALQEKSTQLAASMQQFFETKMLLSGALAREAQVREEFAAVVSLIPRPQSEPARAESSPPSPSSKPTPASPTSHAHFNEPPSPPLLEGGGGLEAAERERRKREETEALSGRVEAERKKLLALLAVSKPA